MASSRIYLSGVTKRKQRQIRNQNEAKSRRTLEVLNWYTKIQRNNKSCCHVNVTLQEKLTMMTLYLLSFVETPRKFIIAELSIRKLGSSSVLIIRLFEFTRPFLS